jgi:serine/threonine-protein kinase
VFLDRCEQWHGVPPGATEPRVVRLPRIGELRDGECFVPPGWFWCGGDPQAIDGLSRRRVWVEGFVMCALPVTHAEFVVFLGGLDPDLALRYVPSERHEGRSQPIYTRSADGRFELPDPAAKAPWAGSWPVVLVDLAAAEAFAAWRSQLDGVEWRLPHDLEWEKAARGVDGRAFPWGDQLEPSFALMGRSHRTDAQMGPVGAFAADVSPYGVRDMAGNVRDLCGNRYDYPGAAEHDGPIDFDRTPSRPDLCMVRGGSWTSVAAWCRSAARFTAAPDERSTAVGFRLVRAIG